MAIRFADNDGGGLTGSNSKDLLWGGDGDDTILGLNGADNLYGGYGDDSLDGGSGADYLRGEAGTDRLWGGSGSDVLAGGSDTDYFIFRAADGTATDTIRDFRVGEDQLVLGDGLRVNANASFRADVDFDGRTDTVLTLSNDATIVLLGVGGNQNWGLAGSNVMTFAELYPIA
jgi:Ca2+-binding RTX toxin-like protein